MAVRYLILSDIHANLEALTAVLEDARGTYDQVICLGDVVGYGADPNATTEWVSANARITVRGNHDKACVGLEDLEWFNPVARAAAEWTRRELTADNMQFLHDLGKGPAIVDDFQVLHGSPLDEDEYLLSTADAAQLVGYLETGVSFFGHTHVQGGFQFIRRRILKIPRIPLDGDEFVLQLNSDEQYMLNPGSVGQPRDGDPRAAYMFYRPGERLAIFRRVPYRISGAQEKILRAGLPDVLAARLELGR